MELCPRKASGFSYLIIRRYEVVISYLQIRQASFGPFTPSPAHRPHSNGDSDRSVETCVASPPKPSQGVSRSNALPKKGSAAQRVNVSAIIT